MLVRWRNIWLTTEGQNVSNLVIALDQDVQEVSLIGGVSRYFLPRGNMQRRISFGVWRHYGDLANAMAAQVSSTMWGSRLNGELTFMDAATRLSVSFTDAAMTRVPVLSRVGCSFYQGYEFVAAQSVNWTTDTSVELQHFAGNFPGPATPPPTPQPGDDPVNPGVEGLELYRPVQPPIDIYPNPRLMQTGNISIPAGDQTVPIAFPAHFDSMPNVICSVAAPEDGDVLWASPRAVTLQGCEVRLSAPAPSAGYSVHWVARTEFVS